MKEFAALRAKTYNYLTDNNAEDKKDKGTKKCVIKREFNFRDYKKFLEATKLENKMKHLEKNRVNAESLGEKHKELIKNSKFINEDSKYLKVKGIMFLLKKLIKLF